MSQSLEAVFENGVLRPLAPLHLKERQVVTLTVETRREDDLLDVEFMRELECDLDDAPSLTDVRNALSKIPGNLSTDVRLEREER